MEFLVVCSCIDSSHPVNYSYEIYKGKVAYAIIGVAIIIIGLSGLLWSSISIHQSILATWKGALILTSSFVFTLIGLFILFVKHVKYGDDSMSISRYSGSNWSAHQNSRDVERYNQQSKDHQSSSVRGQKIADSSNPKTHKSSKKEEKTADESDPAMRRLKRIHEDFSTWYPWDQSPDKLNRNQVTFRALVLASKPGCPFEGIEEDYEICKEKLDMLYKYKKNPEQYETEMYEFNKEVEQLKYKRSQESICTLI